MIKVGVCGALGKMGQEVVQAVTDCPETELVAKIDIASPEMYHTIEAAHRVEDIDVIIDFTQPKSIFENAKYCLNNGIKIVIGTTGLSDEQIAELKKLSQEKNTGCLIAPNFSTGAVLMMMFAKQAAKYFDNAEIIELHHNQKKDAPSGTAIKTAAMMAEVKEDFAKNNCPETETIEGARGGNSYSNIHIHSVRMPGYIASQEVIFGSSGQIMTIRHDSMDRKCYMQGVLLAVKHVAEKNDFVYGLDNIM
ncbi:TPA: 4-hydroxy-tetrahydrodipicolinate reductase [Candidatus Gastranaerophilales bacterium HUM_20]|nr:MAG: 4-hydroxy-tetrahydrodipicolinate reductase [Candidatus Melainabacteria bacterium 35_41]CDE88892.1 dihydrodipicolinate reductase [Clostridium sp. CAG:729]DAB22026.1 MAG TPA: 4-hydroxy-tetrahydrodipicolinate reductase [Candidatus Gastranaerophilales bacterium HUM_20]